MSHLRLIVVLAAFAGLGYMAYRYGWLPASFNQAQPSAEPTLGFKVRASRRRHASRNAANPGMEASMSGLRAPASSKASGTEHNAPSGPNPLKTPGPTLAARTPAIPASFEGCWKGSVTKFDDWTFGRGPIVKGWSPASHELCFHNSGGAPEVTFSTSAEYPLVSDWVVSNNAVENGQAQIMFSGEDFVVLRTTGSATLATKLLGFLPGPTGIITSLTDLHCTHTAGDKLLVEGSTVQRCANAPSLKCDGDVWIRQPWHSEFTRE
jgi:hypothetical protein